MWLAIFAITILGVWVMYSGRMWRINRLRQQAHEALCPTGQQHTCTEYAALAGISSVELLWQWSTINPQVIAAADFSSTLEIGNGLDFARYVHDHISGLEGDVLAGFRNRLLGYVGEQKVTQLLQAQGHVVEVAQTSNQPVWDLLVDGQAVNVKTVLDIAEIKAAALAHPDVLYLVPEDVRGVAIDNIQSLAGFNHAELGDNLETAIVQTDASTTIPDIASHSPIVSFAFSLWRNYQAVQQGRSQEIAIKHVVLDTVGRGCGAGLGAVVLGGVGSIAGPVGALIGAALGSVLGGMIGKELAEEVKQQPLQQALFVFEKQLQKFGASYADRWQRIIEVLYRPWQRQQQNVQQLNNQLQQQQGHIWQCYWPSFSTILLQETVIYGQQQLVQQQSDLQSLEYRLTEAHSQQDYKPLALLLLNVPYLRELLGIDLRALRYLEYLRQQVYHERTELDPALFPPR